MKSIKIFAVASAVALLSTAGFTSCNQNNQPEGPSNYNGEVVKTQFSISIPSTGNNSGILRMPSANAQKGGESQFLGMDEINLLCYETASAAAVTTASTRLGSNIELTDIPAYGETGTLNDLTGTTAANYKVYNDVQIPIGTNRFLFYAHGAAPAAQSSMSVAQSFAYGRLKVDNLAASTPTTVSISPVQINATAPSSDKLQKGEKLAAYLTAIANAVSTDDTPVPWNDCETPYPAFASLYTEFISMAAGSSTSVHALVQDLYTTVNTQADYGNKMAAGIKNAILNSEISSGVKYATEDEGVITFNDGITGFPANINLPDGGVALYWKATPAPAHFIVSTAETWTGIPVNVANYQSFVYPASIYYYVNSGLKTSTAKQQENYGTKTWADVITDCYAGTGNTFVSSTTRSVAIVDEIQYGVADLETSVMASATTLQDHGAINTVNASDLKMTAVLVGGQGAVGFDFIPTADGSYVVYDKDVTEQTLGTSLSTANTTLLLETRKTKDVRMAVEFRNDGPDFFGKDGKLIPQGTKFYMVALLQASAATDQPLVDAGKSTCVFAQDFTTTANLTITSLANAYNVIPDLRSPSLELGFSVDLSWKAGHTYVINFE